MACEDELTANTVLISQDKSSCITRANRLRIDVATHVFIVEDGSVSDQGNGGGSVLSLSTQAHLNTNRSLHFVGGSVCSWRDVACLLHASVKHNTRNRDFGDRQF